MKKLILLDGMAIVYRSFFALNRSPRINSKGFNTSAILGFLNTLLDLVRQQRPSHIAVAFDLQAPTFRHLLFHDYKANRDAMPEVISLSLPYIKQLISAFNIPIVTAEGYEADDVIGTLANAAQNNGFDRVLMVTPDKDFGQLVTDKIHIYHLGHGSKSDQILTPTEICDRFGISKCPQVIDLLGLWGDTADNIPGIPGVGEKTAKKLIAQFGSIENMIANADEIKNDRMRSIIEANAQQALFSKKLATIVLDAPVALDEESFRLKEPDIQRLSEIFDFLEFRNISKRIVSVYRDANISISMPSPARTAPAANEIQTSLFDEPVTDASISADWSGENLKICTSLDQLPILNAIGCSIYFEGSSLALASDAENVFLAPIGDTDTSLLKTILENPSTIKICHDLKQLKYLLAELDISIQGEIFDIQLAHYLVDSEARHSLPFICSAILNESPSDPAQFASAMWLLYPRLSSLLTDSRLRYIYDNIELPLVDVLISMEQEGVRIDVDALKSYSAQLSAMRDDLEQSIFELAGCSFNISSPKQLGEVLFERLKIVDKPPRTASKQYSTAEDVLIKLKNVHPIIDKVLEYRSINKLIGTYLNSFPQLISPISGRLHTVYNQTVTATGRLSSSNPNLQNIPIRTELGREIRRAFVPRNEDFVILAADYSQIELRLIASLANDRHMIEAFNNRYDIHAATAAKIYGIPLDEVSKDQRRNAKSVNFGIVYGISAFGLSEQLSISRKEAAALIDEYFQQYPDIKAYIAQCVERAHTNGYAQTILGRRRYLNDINSRNNSARSFAERNAVNMPIQGSSADMIKLAMIRIFQRFNSLNLKSKMILQVHDELVFDVFRPEIETVKAIVEQEMQQALPLDNLAIEVSIDQGDNWLDAH